MIFSDRPYNNDDDDDDANNNNNIHPGLNSRWSLGRYTWPRDGVSIKTPVVVSPHHHSPINE